MRRTVNVNDARDGWAEIISMPRQQLVALSYGEPATGPGATAAIYVRPDTARQIAAHLIQAAADVEAGR